MSWKKEKGFKRILDRAGVHSTYVRPSHQIVRSFSKITDGWVVHDLVGNVEVIRI